MAVGQQLRKRYDAEMGAPLPDQLQMQLQRLAAAERASGRRRTYRRLIVDMSGEAYAASTHDDRLGTLVK